MSDFHAILKYIHDHFDRFGVLSNLAVAAVSAVMSILTLWLTFIILRFTARPRLGIRLHDRRVLEPSEIVELRFTVFNRGHWYGHPPATGVRIYFNLTKGCEPISLRYGSSLQLEDREVKRGKAGSLYLRAKGISVFYEEPGEDLVLTTKMAPTPGRYHVSIALNSTEGGHVVHRQLLKVRTKLRLVGRSLRATPMKDEWALQVTARLHSPVILPSHSTFLCPVLNQIVAWEELHTFNPAAVVRGKKVFLLYRAEDRTGTSHRGSHTSRVGLAESSDGIHFSRWPKPVVYPSMDDQVTREWPGGCEDPRIVEMPDGAYLLTYTQWNRKHCMIGIATSTDLLTWQKHGPAFGQTEQDSVAATYKSAGILSHKQDGRLIAARLDGSYWMYWGEGNIYLARSEDLVNWFHVRGADGKPIPVMSPRPNMFDSALVEVGPPPILTEDGILLIYNGKNSDVGGDLTLNAHSYAAGQVLFDGADPTRILARLDTPFLRPELPFEIAGQYADGATFGEGIVFFGDAYLLYYGGADSVVAVAVCSDRVQGQATREPLPIK
jgi:beta-1,2-mannosidase